MQKERIWLVVAFFVLIQVSLSSAAQTSLETQTQNEEVRIIQTCATCTFNNISSITYPNSTNFTGVIAMTRIGSEYNYTLPGSFTGPLGVYTVNGLGDINGENRAWVFTFEVTKTGTKLDTGTSIVYIILTFAVFFFFLLSLYLTVRTPYSNEVNARGAVIKVTRKKYLKIGLILLSYVLFVWFLNVLIALSDNFVELTLYYGFISFLFELLTRFSIPFSLFLLVLAFVEIIRDANFNAMFKKLGRPR